MLVKKISRFGIRTGIFDCTLDSRFCKRKGWEKSNVIIALPLGQQPKDNVAIITYDGPSKLQPLLDWINYRLSSRIEIISSERELKTQWIEQTALNKIILVSHMNKSPMFFSALSVKFSGRFKFGKYTLKDEDYESFQQNTGIKKFPSFLIVMPESTFEYGERDGEFQTYKSMEIFLKSFHPEINDVFLMSLVLVNIICFMDVFLVNSTLARRFLKLFWQLGKYNVVTIILWIPLLRIVQLNCMENVCKFGYKVMRLVSQTELACCIRRDWIIYGGYTTLLVISFLMYGIAVSNIRKIFGFSQPSADDNMNISEWWNQTMQQCYHLLIRTSPTFRTRGPNDVHLMENGLDLLIERLAVPDLWLNPLVSNDYICDLPVWSYAGMMCQKYNEAKTASVCRCSVQQLKINNGNEKETSKGPCCHSNCIMQPEDRDEKKETEQCVHNLDCDHTDMKESNDPNSHDAQQPQPPEGMIISQECAICLESYDTESILCGLPCYHTYHHQCIVVWLHGHHCCPICRWPSYKSKGFKCPEHMD
ncbi:E3 ubiquitin-protein ligase RNF103-like [Saccoglossus kowalevskii]